MDIANSDKSTLSNNKKFLVPRMGKSLIITEKPSVAKQFAQTLGVSGSNKGYIEDNKYIITWCVGHLITLSYPEKYDEKYKKWNLEHLPFLPEQYQYEVIYNVREQFKIVKTLFNRSDISVIYNAGDSGREGEYIQRLVLQMAGYNKNAELKRIWIDSQTDEAIRNGIRDAKPFSAYDKLSESAYMRAIEDYSMGINFSRALTCKYGYQFNKTVKSEKFKPINVGRVMTCVLGMIVERERAIRDFVVTPFYKVEADTGFISTWKAVPSSHFFESPLLYNETGFKKKEDTEKLRTAMTKDARLMIENVEKKKELKKAPLLYNLAELQNECSKKFKISPDKTLEIVQKLYELKMTTYPRTDARVISTAVCSEIGKTLNGLAKETMYKEIIVEISKNKWSIDLSNTKYCDDKQITDHYAIIPTGQELENIKSLSELESSVYDMIVRRFLSVFYPPAEYMSIQVALIHPSGEQFFTSKKTLSVPGYLTILDKELKIEDNVLLNVKANEILQATFSIKEGTTTPPKRYDSGSIILAMENAGNLIEDEELRAQIKESGIGTSATRAEIIKKLISVGYICLNSKTQILTPHTDGEAVYDIVKETIPALLSPKMTANWEKGLVQIEHSEITSEKYKSILENYIRSNIDKIKVKNTESRPVGEKTVVGKCPSCGGDILKTTFGYGCSNYKSDKSGCSFSIGGTIASKLDEEQLKKLLTIGKTDVITGFVSKNNKKFDAAIAYNKEENKVEFCFPENKEEKESKVVCPQCAKHLNIEKWKYTCQCGFSINHTVAGKRLTEKQISDLLTDGKSEKISGFTSKKGKSFSARLLYKDEKITFDI